MYSDLKSFLDSKDGEALFEKLRNDGVTVSILDSDGESEGDE
jgi:hypothetical protein